jgi:hypothetical protein
MEASIRPWFTSGVAVVGATAIALAPVSPIPTSSPVEQVRAVTAAVSAQFDLAALDIPYILTLPIVRQYIRNWAQNWAVYLSGLAQAGVGAAQSLLAIPGVTVEVLQEVLTLNFVGAFETITTAARDAVVAVGQPLLDSLIWRNQKYYAVQTALRAAVPQAFIDATNGFLTAGNLVVTSLIEGTQNLVAAFLTFNLGNIVNAAVDGTVNFLGAVGDGASAIVDGIESAQYGIATALATEPPPTAAVADVSVMRTLSVDNTVSVSGGGADEPVAETVSKAEPTPEVEPVVEAAPLAEAARAVSEKAEPEAADEPEVKAAEVDKPSPADVAAAASPEKPSETKPAADKPADDKPAADKPSDDKASKGGDAE